MKTNFTSSRIRSCFATTMAISFMAVTLSSTVAQDSFDRLFKKVEQIPLQVTNSDTCQVPSAIAEPAPAIQTRYIEPQVSQQIGDEPPVMDDPDFKGRVGKHLEPTIYFPEPLGRRLNRGNAMPKRKYARGEYVFDGQDKGTRVTVDDSWIVYGLDIEDTVGHFDTLDGQRLVSPSNRVAIYSPRFSAVRKVSEFGESYAATQPRQFEERDQTLMASKKDDSAITRQYEQLSRHQGTDRASSILDETRGIVSDNTTHLFGVRNMFSPFENLEIMRFGRYSSAEQARLNLGMQSANVWQDDLGLQVSAGKVQPIIVNDDYRVQQIDQIESKYDNDILRVIKLASHIAAKPGEIIEFTIRYDNISSKKIGNVTIIDNLSARLEYIPDSAECTHHADFINKANQAGSLQLRWEIRDPIPAGEGGLVRFQCRVR